MSNGDSAGLESADAGSQGNSGNRATKVCAQLDLLAEAKAVLVEWGEQTAAQEIDDAVCRITTEAAREARERQRSGEALHGSAA